MPNNELYGRTDPAVLWAAVEAGTGKFTRYGKHNVHPPVDIMVRWDDQNRETTNAKGEIIKVDGQLLLAQAIPIGSIMAKGTIASQDTPPVNLFYVNGYNEANDTKGRNPCKTCTVERFGDTLPMIVGTGT
jgi:hypothetical protein